MSQKIYKFEEIIGQTSNKSIILKQLEQDRLSQFIFLYGDSGSGKSTMAETIAMAATCEKHRKTPCMTCARCQDNLQALQTSGLSRNIKKINIGKLITKDDIKSLLREVFDLKAIPGEKTFYILEEVHLLGKNQDMLLEELERIPKDTHVIMCTTNYNDILETLKTRAQLKLHFKRLTPAECRILIDRLSAKYSITTLSTADKAFLANVTNCNAREITNFLETFSNEQDFATLMRSYFSSIPVSIYLDLVNSLFKDFPNFIVYINSLENTNNLIDIWNGFHSFIRDSVFYIFGGGVTLFTNTEKSKIKNLFEKIPTEKIAKLYRLSNKPVKNQMEAEYNLVTLREFLQDIEPTAKKMKVDTVNENKTALAMSTKTENAKKNEIMKKIDIKDLNNLATHNFVYDIPVNFEED